MSRVLCATVVVLLLSSANAFAQGNSVLTGGWTNQLGEKATASVIKFKDGRIKGFVRWILPEGSTATFLDLVVDEAEFGVGAPTAYLAGAVYFDGVLNGRGIIKLIDNGEGASGPGPDRESYLVLSSAPTWGLGDAQARHLVDTPAVWDLPDWFETVDGNIQVHAR